MAISMAKERPINSMGWMMPNNDSSPGLGQMGGGGLDKLKNAAQTADLAAQNETIKKGLGIDTETLAKKKKKARGSASTLSDILGA